MNRPLIVLDVESNGLDLTQHVVWEVAWWDLTTGDRATFLPYINDARDFLATADLDALRINRFVDRWTAEYRDRLGYSLEYAAAGLRLLLDRVWPDHKDPETRATMVCANPQFDLAMMSKTMVAHGVTAEWAPKLLDQVAPWSYRAHNFASYAAGVLGLDVAHPEGVSSIAARLGIHNDAPHTATGDVTMVGRSMLLLMWIQENAPGFSLGELDRILDDAPSGDDIDALAVDFTAHRAGSVTTVTAGDSGTVCG